MSQMPHTAFLLAAGLGTRMRPLTEKTPKPLLEVAGRSMLDRLLDVLVAAEVQRAIVNVHWLPEQVEAAATSRGDIEIVLSDERVELLETGGALAKARGLLGEDPVFVLNTDAIWGPATPSPLHALAEAYDPAHMDELLLLADTGRSLGFHGAGDFFRAETGALTRRGEAPRAPWAYAGVRIANPAKFDGLPVEKFSANRIWEPMLAEERLHGLPLEAFWLHVGDPKALEDATMWMRCHGY
ncbi:MAG: nucleotidyltransferase family protein [Hyphomonadaceae bacterium]|nr:nucleotidyltransferase family protein [Hyphomonadaceae bacterium]